MAVSLLPPPEDGWQVFKRSKRKWLAFTGGSEPRDILTRHLANLTPFSSAKELDKRIDEWHGIVSRIETAMEKAQALVLNQHGCGVKMKVMLDAHRPIQQMRQWLDDLQCDLLVGEGDITYILSMFFHRQLAFQ
jgi:hypothetical protein